MNVKRFNNKKFSSFLFKKFSPKNLKKDTIELKRAMSKRDLLYLIIFPMITALIMIFPHNLIEILKLNIHHPSWWQILTSSFVHGDFNHFLANIGMFLLIDLLQIIIISRMNEQKRYFYLLSSIMLSFPILSSILELILYPTLIPSVEISCGSSGIVSAVSGFIPIILIFYLSKSRNKDLLDWRIFYSLLFYVVLWFLIIYFPFHQNVLYIIVISLLLSILIFSCRRCFKEIIIGILDEINKNIISYIILISLLILFLMAPIILFPTNIIFEGGLIDFFIHYFGLIYGMVISYIFFKKLKL